MEPSPETTLVIVMGASDFPQTDLGSNKAFLRLAERFKKYLLAGNGFGLPEKNLLYLFDSENDPLAQDISIDAFLIERIESPSEPKRSPRDVIVYYVGHGGFTRTSRYYLALKATKKNNEALTGYLMEHLIARLMERVSLHRRYLILDCCFAGEATKHFQTTALDLARQQIREKLPARGTALLCAASSDLPAQAPAGLEYTMFSGALMEVLEAGAADIPESLSLRDVGIRVQALMRDIHGSHATRPEIHSPQQADGDVATLPLFPNLGLDLRALSAAHAALKLSFRELLQAHQAEADRAQRSEFDRVRRLRAQRRYHVLIGLSIAFVISLLVPVVLSQLNEGKLRSEDLAKESAALVKKSETLAKEVGWIYGAAKAASDDGPDNSKGTKPSTQPDRHLDSLIRSEQFRLVLRNIWENHYPGLRDQGNTGDPVEQWKMETKKEDPAVTNAKAKSRELAD